MARKRYGPTAASYTAPSQLVDATPRQALLSATYSWLQRNNIFRPSVMQLQWLDSFRTKLFNPSKFCHHNREQFLIIKVGDLRNNVLSGYAKRDCAACLRPLLLDPISGETDEFGDMVLLHRERQLMKTSAATANLVLPPVPPLGTLAMGE